MEIKAEAKTIVTTFTCISMSDQMSNISEVTMKSNAKIELIMIP